MQISNKINGMENAQAAQTAEKRKERRQEKKRKSGKLFEMNLKLCVIHNHEARDS